MKDHSVKFNGRIITIVRAKCDVHGLQQKYFLPLMGAPVLQRFFERIAQSDLTGTIIVATTSQEEDDALYDFCTNRQIPVYRGGETDLLDLHYKIAMQYQADAVVIIQADSILIDPRVIDRVIKHYLENHVDFDYVSNLHPATYPAGYGVEVMSTESLQRAWCSAKRKLERGDITSYIWKNQHLFDVDNIVCEAEIGYAASYRWTLQLIDDYIFAQNIYEALYEKKPNFGLNDILHLLLNRPELTGNLNFNPGLAHVQNFMSESRHIGC